jgi:hypothetical protein
MIITILLRAANSQVQRPAREHWHRWLNAVQRKEPNIFLLPILKMIFKYSFAVRTLTLEPIKGNSFLKNVP